jgi:hypothetical protein
MSDFCLNCQKKINDNSEYQKTRASLFGVGIRGESKFRHFVRERAKSVLSDTDLERYREECKAYDETRYGPKDDDEFCMLANLRIQNDNDYKNLGSGTQARIIRRGHVLGGITGDAVSRYAIANCEKYLK